MTITEIYPRKDTYTPSYTHQVLGVHLLPANLKNSRRQTENGLIVFEVGLGLKVSLSLMLSRPWVEDERDSVGRRLAERLRVRGSVADLRVTTTSSASSAVLEGPPPSAMVLLVSLTRLSSAYFRQCCTALYLIAS